MTIRVTKRDDNETVTVEKPCGICGNIHEMTFNAKAWDSYEEDRKKPRREQKFIQELLPGTGADDREMLISGTCPSCWEDMFGPDEE